MEACKKLVEYTEAISANYGLKLNKGRCVNLEYGKTAGLL